MVEKHIKFFKKLYKEKYKKFIFRCDKNNWLMQFENYQYRSMVESLIKEYKYFSYEQLLKNCKKLYNKLEKDNIDIDKANIISTTDKRNFHYSFLFYLLFMTKNHISYKLNDVFDKQKKVIVIVDDCSETGKTIIKTIKKVCNEYGNNYLYYILVVTISTIARTNIIRIFKQLNISKFKIEKADILDTYQVFDSKKIFGENSQYYKNIYVDICKDKKIYSENCMGFENAQGLTSFYYNTPNTTLSLFWKTAENYSPLFFRLDEKKYEYKKMRLITENLKSFFSFLGDKNEVKIIFDSLSLLSFFDNEYFVLLCEILGRNIYGIFERLNELVKSGYLFVNEKIEFTKLLCNLISKYDKQLMNIYKNELFNYGNKVVEYLPPLDNLMFD